VKKSKACVTSLSGLLPRLWAHFRTSADAPSATVSKTEFCRWLAEERRRTPSSVYQGALLKNMSKPRGARLVQRMGFRFKDPSSKGSWSVDNLQGFLQRSLGARERRRTEVAWNDYVASYSASAGGDGSIELHRDVTTRPLVATVEKHTRGSKAFPTSQVKIVVTAKSRRQEAERKRKTIKVMRRSADLLPAVVIRPAPSAGPPQWTLIYLHGLGGSALGNYVDKPHYFLDGSVALKVVVPTAPSRELSCYPWWHKRKPKSGGRAQWHLQKFLAWYDYLSDNDGKREDELDLESLIAIRTVIHDIIKREAALLGGRPERVILGGKSQGCCTALDAALTYPEALGGIIGLVGHLLSCTPVAPDGAQAAVPIHFFHEPEDKLMQWHWVEAAERRLRDAGYNIHSRHCPDPGRGGHFIEGVEGRWIRTALKSICK